MSQGMQKLVEFQKVVLDLRRVRREQEEAPRQKEALEDKRRLAEEEFVRAEEALEAHRLERRAMEGELDDFEEKLGKYKEQLMSVKTNKEYTAMLHEIKTVKQLVSDKETAILTQMDLIEDERKQVAEADRLRKASLDELVTRGERLEARIVQLREEEGSLEEERARLEKDVPANLLERFNRLAAVRDGIALSEAVDERCSTCHQRLRPQIWHEVRHTDNDAICDGCGRMLYYEHGPSAS